MVIVDLPDTDGTHFIRLNTERGYTANVWGIAEVDMGGDNNWHITIRNDKGSIVGFYHADAIRRD